jgi:hypothetical protein
MNTECNALDVMTKAHRLESKAIGIAVYLSYLCLYSMTRFWSLCRGVSRDKSPRLLRVDPKLSMGRFGLPRSGYSDAPQRGTISLERSVASVR